MSVSTQLQRPASPHADRIHTERIRDVVRAVEHRPWPLPRGPWIMAQRWHDLLFAHWPIAVETLRPLVPPQLELDTFDGETWVGIVPFRMSGVRPRHILALPWLSAFPELNVRVYVRATDSHAREKIAKPGVYFFSLEAANPVAVSIARRVFRLPYFRAHMRFRELPSGTIDYRSYRTHRDAPSAEFVARYAPSAETDRARPGSLAAWLTERYCLYTTDRRGRVYRGDIHHRQWPLQPAEAEIEVNTMARAAGLTLPDCAPLLHFSRRLDVAVWPLQRVTDP